MAEEKDEKKDSPGAAAEEVDGSLDGDEPRKLVIWLTGFSEVPFIIGNLSRSLKSSFSISLRRKSFNSLFKLDAYG